jgi:hypothetical protein
LKQLLARGLAALSGFALCLQLYLSIRRSLDQDMGIAHGVWMYLAFFTMWTNLVVAVTLSLPQLRPHGSSGRFFSRPGVVTAVAAYIVLVCLAYSLLLRNTWHPQGYQQLADILLHDAIPALFLAYWWLVVPRGTVHWTGIPRWSLYPLAYFAYALARGALTGFYPYPFIDVVRLGMAQVLLNAVGILLGFLGLAALLVGLKGAPRRGT